MMGPPDDEGVIPRSFRQIFSYMKNADDEKKFVSTVSYIELYNEQIRDLLAKGADLQKRLEIHENPEKGIHIPNLTTHMCESAQAMLNVMNKGAGRRITGSIIFFYLAV
jgi:kinesin family protein 3/17